MIANGEWQVALDMLEALFKHASPTYADWISRGRCYAGLKQWDKMAAAYKQALESGATSGDAWYQLAYAHMQLRQWKDSLAATEQGSAASPKHAGVWHLRAVALNGLKRYEEALTAVDRAVELGDKSPWLHNHRAAALFELKRFDDAIVEFSTFLTTVKDHSNSWSKRGESYVQKKMWSEALADFEEARRLEPENAQRWYTVAALHLASGNVAEYRAACAKMREHFSETKSATYASPCGYVGVVLPVADADRESIVRLARIGTSLFNGNERVLGAALVRAGQYQAALAQFDESAKNFTPRAWDWLFRAMAHHHLQQHEQARECLAKAVKWIDELEKKSGKGDTDLAWFAWYERVEVEYMLREAKKLIEK
jgi:tetratricopeptide (TPR) repeat protein